MSLVAFTCVLLASQTRQIGQQRQAPSSTYRYATLPECVDAIRRGSVTLHTEQSLIHVRNNGGRDAVRASFYLARLYQHKLEIAPPGTDITRLKNLSLDGYETARTSATYAGLRSDAIFYESMLDISTGAGLRAAKRRIDQIRAGEDKYVFVDRVIWTQDSRYAVNQSVDSCTLRDNLKAILHEYDGDNTFPDVLANEIARKLTGTSYAKS